MTPIPHTCRRPRTQRNSNMLRRAAVCACPPFMARAEERAYAAQQKSKQVNGAECLFSFYFFIIFFTVLLIRENAISWINERMLQSSSW